MSKRDYEVANEKEKGDVIAYQIRQSFKPGEITSEEANRIGYETAMRFTKGNHAFIVATHTDRNHIHNHVIFNSTTLKGDRKFTNFSFSGIALRRLSNARCLPELCDYCWHDILKIAAYKQYNSAIPVSAQCSGTGRLKSGYKVEDIMCMFGETDYSELHNALTDALDELRIMSYLKHPINMYLSL